MKKVFRKQTLYIKDSVMLEEVKDIFNKQGFTTLWGCDATYELDKIVSSGYLHYQDKTYFLSKEPLGKEVLSYDFFKWSLEHITEDKKTFTLEEVKDAIQFGLDYGYHKGFSDASMDEAEYKEEPFDTNSILKDWLKEGK